MPLSFQNKNASLNYRLAFLLEALAGFFAGLAVWAVLFFDLAFGVELLDLVTARAAATGSNVTALAASLRSLRSACFLRLSILCSIMASVAFLKARLTSGSSSFDPFLILLSARRRLALLSKKITRSQQF